jgi:hypothetical protein
LVVEEVRREPDRTDVPGGSCTRRHRPQAAQRLPAGCGF